MINETNNIQYFNSIFTYNLNIITKTRKLCIVIKHYNLHIVNLKNKNVTNYHIYYLLKYVVRK